MNYIDTIKSITPLSLDDIIKTAKQHVPAQYQHAPWNYPGLAHGTAILQDDEQLCCYLASYGEMHQGKLACAFAKFPYINLDKNIEIIDWGCGQGLASIYFIDNLRQHNLLEKLQKVTLIEPSYAALSRAKLHLQQAVGDNVYIDILNYYLPSTEDSLKANAIGGIHIEEPICIHLFSNILDIHLF